jgi:hypothetical protein
MTMNKHDLMMDLRRRYGTGLSTSMVAPSVVETMEHTDAIEKAFVLEAEHRTIITAPIRELAATNEGFTYLRGRMVGADTPNQNGALWTTEDLQLGERTVAGGPVNWLHQETKIVGCLMDGQMVSGREAAATGVGNHIVSTAAIWRFLFPRETATMEAAAKDGQLYQSMECVSRSVACTGTESNPGCGQEVDYAAYDAKGPDLCSHLRERSHARRFIDPIFLGTAVIVPPVQPAWANASLEVVRQAAAATEGRQFAALDEAGARDLASTILMWANREI